MPSTLPPSSLTFLGTGTSVGVPVIGCDCAVCLSDDPKNTRLRSSVILRSGETTLLVDTGPDLRQQALTHQLTAIDAVLYTHEHVDHVAGFDELRAFCWRRDEPLPLYATPDCLKALTQMYGWAFGGQTQYKGYVRVAPIEIIAPFEIAGIRVTPLPVLHGSVTVIGFRFDLPEGVSLSYIPDIKELPPSTLPLITDSDILIIDALGDKIHPTHMSTGEAIQVARDANVKATYFTHMGHGVDLSGRIDLPPHFSYAYDGLTLPLS